MLFRSPPTKKQIFPPLLHHLNQPNKSQQTHTKITQIKRANYQHNPLPPPPIQIQHNHRDQNPSLHESKPTIISKNQTHRKKIYNRSNLLKSQPPISIANPLPASQTTDLNPHQPPHTQHRNQKEK